MGNGSLMPSAASAATIGDGTPMPANESGACGRSRDRDDKKNPPDIGWPRFEGHHIRGNQPARFAVNQPARQQHYSCCAPRKGQSLVILANGLVIRTFFDAKSTTTASSPSTRMTRPRPYLSWVTRSCSSYCSIGGASGGGLK